MNNSPEWIHPDDCAEQASKHNKIVYEDECPEQWLRCTLCYWPAHFIFALFMQTGTKFWSLLVKGILNCCRPTHPRSCPQYAVRVNHPPSLVFWLPFQANKGGYLTCGTCLRSRTTSGCMAGVVSVTKARKGRGPHGDSHLSPE